MEATLEKANVKTLPRGEVPVEVSRIAMLLTLVSFSMLFATLFLGFAFFRLTADVWPPFGIERVPLFYPALSTVVIALSSLTFWRFEKTRAGGWYFITMSFGLTFMFLQLKFWSFLKTVGIYASTGTFGSLIYGLTWIHAAHVVAALLLLLWIIPTANSRAYFQEKALRVQNVGKFWHFLGVVWFLMFVILFVF